MPNKHLVKCCCKINGISCGQYRTSEDSQFCLDHNFQNCPTTSDRPACTEGALFTSMQCKGYTKNGERCQLPPLLGSDFCRHHNATEDNQSFVSYPKTKDNQSFVSDPETKSLPFIYNNYSNDDYPEEQPLSFVQQQQPQSPKKKQGWFSKLLFSSEKKIPESRLNDNSNLSHYSEYDDSQYVFPETQSQFILQKNDDTQYFVPKSQSQFILQRNDDTQYIVPEAQTQSIFNKNHDTQYVVPEAQTQSIFNRNDDTQSMFDERNDFKYYSVPKTQIRTYNSTLNPLQNLYKVLQEDNKYEEEKQRRIQMEKEVKRQEEQRKFQMERELQEKREEAERQKQHLRHLKNLEKLEKKRVKELNKQMNKLYPELTQYNLSDQPSKKPGSTNLWQSLKSYFKEPIVKDSGFDLFNPYPEEAKSMRTAKKKKKKKQILDFKNVILETMFFSHYNTKLPPKFRDIWRKEIDAVMKGQKFDKQQFKNEAQKFLDRLILESEQETTKPQCSICLEELEENYFSCPAATEGSECFEKHKFHENCLMKWFEYNDQCPMCRRNCKNIN